MQEPSSAAASGRRWGSVAAVPVSCCLAAGKWACCCHCSMGAARLFVCWVAVANTALQTADSCTALASVTPIPPVAAKHQQYLLCTALCLYAVGTFSGSSSSRCRRSAAGRGTAAVPSLADSAVQCIHCPAAAAVHKQQQCFVTGVCCTVPEHEEVLADGGRAAVHNQLQCWVCVCCTADSRSQPWPRAAVVFLMVWAWHVAK